ncbi:hypothetical protein JYU21_00265 [Alkaliphilus sp. AH-315-G20]|nr:hypothetical protein [bacterium AH-315-L21]MBN4062599.1 hypothetical protein [Alkaliphilus sp. AH-315-G20]
MSNFLMIIGLVGMLIGILTPVLRVYKRKAKYSKGVVLLVFISLFLFIIGVLMGA